MHIHQPKAIRGWGELAKEIGIIVVGVLIALFFEQIVQGWEWRHKVHASEEAMKLELLSDDGPEIYQRAVMHPCLVARLNAIRSAVERNGRRDDINRLIDSYWVQFLTFDSLAHDAANASDVSTHMPPDELTRFTNAYSMMPLMDRTTVLEAADLGRLRALSRSGGALSQAEANEVLNAVEALRNDDRMMWVSAKFGLPYLRGLGPFDSARMQHFIDNARSHYGTCIHDLPPDFPNKFTPSD
jgi:hypothetical protein